MIVHIMSYDHLRDLHSFPTRRSSDLGGGAALARRGGEGALWGGAARVALESPDGLNERSEEHTSELQSPCNLVCRLLLEKKMKEDIMAYEQLIDVKTASKCAKRISLS